MIKYTILVALLAFRLSYQPSMAQTTAPAAFANVSAVPSAILTGSMPARLLNFKGKVNNNKIVLSWEVGENETADMFEVEKSTDGVNFIMAALVFGTDKAALDNYEFYEKAGNHKVLYRIKLIDKNKKAAYSTVVEINPAA